MRPTAQDPTAGVTALTIRARPGVPRPIHDPTDPRCDAPTRENGAPARVPQRILDPTDPECGKVAA